MIYLKYYKLIVYMNIIKDWKETTELIEVIDVNGFNLERVAKLLIDRSKNGISTKCSFYWIELFVPANNSIQ